ncbi:MAG: double zinc ribbon domain-containing protein [Spirochaetaceae bacterium]|jgi:ComF family protein|nr:double zinc ribbon domain-containing protein [Spirochaetaceae bacterium]
MKTLNIALKLSLLKEYLFPAGCAVCGRTLFDEHEAWFGLCVDCAGGFPLSQEPRCAVCGRPLISEAEICMNCRKKTPDEANPDYDDMTLLYPYIGRTQTLLRSYKFGKHRALARFFSEKLLSSISGINCFTEKIPCVPVPPRPGKIKTAGWDQIECIAKILEKSMPVMRCLKRLSSKTQKELGKSERLTNLQGRIICIKKPPEELIIFDDVFTTGSTMNVCAKTLKESGAKKVHGICLFYD